ncbi:hypothetical protein HAX54_019728, partial [Datura stramonium]|nr:hypothetical protein [Datura stramonium]
RTTTSSQRRNPTPPPSSPISSSLPRCFSLRPNNPQTVTGLQPPPLLFLTVSLFSFDKRTAGFPSSLLLFICSNEHLSSLEIMLPMNNRPKPPPPLISVAISTAPAQKSPLPWRLDGEPPPNRPRRLLYFLRVALPPLSQTTTPTDLAKLRPPWTNNSHRQTASVHEGVKD